MINYDIVYYKGFSLHTHQNASGWRTNYETWAARGRQETVNQVNGYPYSPWKRVGGWVSLPALTWSEEWACEFADEMLASFDKPQVPNII